MDRQSIIVSSTRRWIIALAVILLGLGDSLPVYSQSNNEIRSGRIGVEFGQTRVGRKGSQYKSRRNYIMENNSKMGFWSVGVLGGASFNWQTRDAGYAYDMVFDGGWGGYAGISATYMFFDWLSIRADIMYSQKNYGMRRMTPELQKMNIDLTFTQNEQEFQHSHQIVTYINQSLISFPMIKPLLLILKRYFKIMKMNKSFHGGLSSYSLYLLIYAFFKKFPTSNSSSGKALYSFLAFFSFFEFHKYGIDIDHTNIYFLQNNYISNSFDFEEETKKNEINIIDPLTKLNVAKSSFKVVEIQNTFRNAYDFLRTEGCYYDYAILANKTGYENNYFSLKSNFEFDNANDFKTIKKLFALNKNGFFFNFFSN